MGVCQWLHDIWYTRMGYSIMEVIFVIFIYIIIYILYIIIYYIYIFIIYIYCI